MFLTFQGGLESCVQLGFQPGGLHQQPGQAGPACLAAPPPAALCPGSGCEPGAPSAPAGTPALAPAAPAARKHHLSQQPVFHAYKIQKGVPACGLLIE